MTDLHCVTDERGVTTLTIDRPERHNALDRELIDAMASALHSIESITRVLVIAGSGNSFCAGADIAWMKASIALSEADNRADAAALSSLLESLDTFPHPTIARIQGAAIGGGSGLAACCDIAIANETALFGFPEVRLGLLPATISPYVLSAIGAREARRWFLTGERFDAVTAYRLGLVHDVCSTDNLDTRVDERVKALLAGGPEAQRATKQLVMDVAGRPVTENLRQEVANRLAKQRAGTEAQEGLTAFLEKRKPGYSL